MAVINGTNSSNNIIGNLEGDQINGFGGNDIIDGQGGDDYIIGGTGDDTLTGGAGNDIFAFTARNFDLDVVSDFTAGDRIDLTAFNVADLATLQRYITQSGANTVITLAFGGGTERITINNVLPAALTSSSFIFNVKRRNERTNKPTN